MDEQGVSIEIMGFGWIHGVGWKASETLAFLKKIVGQSLHREIDLVLINVPKNLWEELRNGALARGLDVVEVVNRET